MMNRISRFINKEKLSKTRAWANEHALIRYVLVFLTIAYVLATYKIQFMDWYDNNIMPILGYFISNIWIRLLTFILCVVAIYDIQIAISLYSEGVIRKLCHMTYKTVIFMEGCIQLLGNFFL